MDTNPKLDIFVADPGTDTIRLGRAEDFPSENKTPYLVVPSRVQKETEDGSKVENQIFAKDGCVRDWDAYEAVFDLALYHKLGWPEGDEGYITITENSLRTPRRDRERLTQMLFEVFNIRGLYILDTCVASMYAAGKVTGLAVDIGHSGTTIGQVVEGGLVPGAAMYLPQGGEVLELALKKHLALKGLLVRQEQIRNLKEAATCVAKSHEDFMLIRRSDNAETFTLPDGHSVSVSQYDRSRLG